MKLAHSAMIGFSVLASTAAMSGLAAAEKMGTPVPPPSFTKHTWTITPLPNLKMQPKTVVYDDKNAAYIYDVGSPKPSAANATWKLYPTSNYVVMWAKGDDGGMRAFRSVWGANGERLMPLQGYSCQLVTPSHSPTFNCIPGTDGNYTQAENK